MKYSKETVEKICNLIALDDYTIIEICQQVGISKAIFFKWKGDKADFLEKIEAAEAERLDTFKKAARSGLLVLLNGKEYEEVTKEYVEGKSAKPGKAAEPKLKSIKKVKKFIMPNPVAVLSTLKNLDKENFNETFKVEHTGKDGSKLFAGFDAFMASCANLNDDDQEKIDEAAQL